MRFYAINFTCRSTRSSRRSSFAKNVSEAMLNSTKTKSAEEINEEPSPILSVIIKFVGFVLLSVYLFFPLVGMIRAVWKVKKQLRKEGYLEDMDEVRCRESRSEELRGLVSGTSMSSADTFLFILDPAPLPGRG